MTAKSEKKPKSAKEAAQGKARKKQKEFARVTYVFVGLFLVLLGYIGYFQVKRVRISYAVHIMRDRIQCKARDQRNDRRQEWKCACEDR